MPGDGACPHAEIQFCPLYVASHEGDGLGCADDKMEWGGCAVSRGMDYAAAIARLRPRLVAECRLFEKIAAARAQRLRNMRAAGIQ